MRYAEYLRMRYAAMLDILGRALMVVGGVIASPVILVIFYPAEVRLVPVFLLVGGGLSAVGLLLWKVFVFTPDDALTYQEGTVVVVLIWVITMLVSVIPFMAIMDMTFTQAAFESVSGWTSTGLTVVDIANAPHMILFFRSVTQLIGAAGVVIIVLNSLAGPSGIGLTAAEGRSAQLVPNVRESAVLVFQLYLAYTLLGIVALIAVGMTPFDAVNHAFAAIATGGFSTQPASIGYFDSLAIEVVIMVLMILGSINFLTAYTFFSGKAKAALRSTELRFFVVLVIVMIGIVFAAEPTHGLRAAAFETVSVISTAGFTTTTYDGWQPFTIWVFVVLMMVGGSTESTAGGIKQLRIVTMLRIVRFEVRRAFMPDSAVNEPSYFASRQREYITGQRVRQVALFAFSYVVTLAVGTAIFAAHGYSIEQSLFEFGSSLGTVGLSVGVIGPDVPPTLLWTSMAGMFLGRLEILALVIGVGKLLVDLPTLTFGGQE